MARANTMSAGAGGGDDRRTPREFAEELRAISLDEDADPDPVAAAASQLQQRTGASPSARENPGERQPVQARPPHRVIPARRAQAPEEAPERRPVEPRVVRLPDEPAVKPARVKEDDEVANASEAAARIASQWNPDAEDGELVRVLCFLEERSLDEIVDAVVRDYIESRAQDEDVQAVMKARGHYRKV